VGTVLLTIFISIKPAALIEMPIDFESTTLTYPWEVLEVLFGAIPFQ
jgi:hypothetical protein